MLYGNNNSQATQSTVKIHTQLQVARKKFTFYQLLHNQPITARLHVAQKQYIL